MLREKTAGVSFRERGIDKLSEGIELFLIGSSLRALNRTVKKRFT